MQDRMAFGVPHPELLAFVSSSWGTFHAHMDVA